MSTPSQTPATGSVRASIERASTPILLRLSKLPVWLPMVVLIGLILGGSLLGGPAGLALVLLAALVVAWLLYLTWPSLRTSERMMRLAVLALVLLLPVTKFIQKG